jgi:hypothetical protein
MNRNDLTRLQVFDHRNLCFSPVAGAAPLRWEKAGSRASVPSAARSGTRSSSGLHDVLLEANP